LCACAHCIIIISFYTRPPHCSACLHCIYYYCGGGPQNSGRSGAASTRVLYYNIISPLFATYYRYNIILFPYTLYFIFILSIKIQPPISAIVAIVLRAHRSDIIGRVEKKIQTFRFRNEFSVDPLTVVHGTIILSYYISGTHDIIYLCGM